MAATKPNKSPESTSTDPVKTWKFNAPDLSDMGLWMLNRLSQKAPHLNDRNFVGWLRNCMESNEFMFIRSQNAVGLAQRVSDVFDPVPRVVELFVWVRDREKMGEAATIYAEFQRWAVSLGSKEMLIERDTDAPLEMLKAHFGTLYERMITVAKL